MIAGAINSAPLWAASFDYFLAEARKEERKLSIFCAAQKLVMCSFLVAAQETNQRKRLGEALTAKPFVTASVYRPFCPALSRPPPDPLPAPIEGLVVVGVAGTCVRFWIHFPAMRRGFLKGAHLLAAPLKPDSFGTFLAGTRKVHTSHLLSRKNQDITETRKAK